MYLFLVRLKIFDLKYKKNLLADFNFCDNLSDPLENNEVVWSGRIILYVITVTIYPLHRLLKFKFYLTAKIDETRKRNLTRTDIAILISDEESSLLNLTVRSVNPSVCFKLHIYIQKERKCQLFITTGCVTHRWKNDSVIVFIYMLLYIYFSQWLQHFWNL